ncbi:MAG TPA: HAMP domain-containing sensor histidine kinase [Candidatus Limnocylindria bacterium]|nr:HAMP domain-containing sensor histidine kinase [Candidatus Limnocylindria bacterium]
MRGDDNGTEAGLEALKPVDGADLESLRAAYRAEQDRLLAQRIPITAAIYLVMVGSAIGVEWSLFPERRVTAGVFYGIHVGVSVFWLLLAWWRPARLRLPTVAAGLASCWSLVLTAYMLFVGGNPERLASGHICLLYGVFFLLPWRTRDQLLVGLVSVLGSVAAGIGGDSSEQFAYAVVVDLTALVTSVGGVVYLDRYRFCGFVRQAQLVRASREKQEEAEIAAALLKVSEALSQHVNELDPLAHLTRVAVQTVGCDWATTFHLDPRDNVYRLAGVFGEPPGVREEIEAAEFDARNLPLVRHIEAGLIVEIADADQQDPEMVSPRLLARWRVASELVAPITMAGRVVGALCLAYTQRRGPFSARERRLAQGIVHATALALANSSLINDLRAANKLRSEFVSTMSHELRTPLNIILGFAEMAQDESIPEAERRKLLRGVQDSGRELLRLIEDTLAMGRIESGHDAVELERVQASALWEQLRRECAILPRKPNVAFEWQPLLGDATLVTDPRKLIIVMRNLVHNALKFTEEGWVQVQLALESAALVLNVTDTGIGIDPRDHTAVFEMFRQGDGSDTRRFGGTGLGLHIVRRFVEQLGGTVTLHSVPGVGSRFSVTLPFERPPRVVSQAA